MSKVLVIEDTTVEEYVTKFSVDDIERDAIEHFIEQISPGDLLASFKVNGSIRLRTVEKKLQGYLSEDRPVRVLILEVK